MSQTSLLSASRFIDSIGVNTHVAYAWGGYNNVSLVTQSLKYLGVDTVRDAMANLPQAQPVMQALAEAGYKFDLIVSSNLPASGPSALASYVGSLESFAKAYPGSIVALEGLNEANIQKFVYQGSSSMAAAGQFQADFYTAVKGDAVLKDIPVYNLTLGHNNATDYQALGDMSAWSDYANAHAYVSTNSTVGTALTTSLTLSQHSAGAAPSVITETGYTTLASTADVGVSEAAQAKNILNTLVDAFSRGVEKTYLYELLDRGSDPGMTDKEAHFGLFRADGAPKMAAAAVHNLTWILADDSAGTSMPTTLLSYSLAGLPSQGGSMLLAKSNGAYDLVVWNAPKVWDDAADKDIVTAQTPVTVHLGAVASKIYVYDPLSGSTPVAVYDNVKDVVLPISDHPLIVEIGGPGPRTQTPVVTPAVVTGTDAEILAQLDTLNASTTLQKIVLTDGQTLSVASKMTLDFILQNYKTALSKIEGDVTFAIAQTAPTWQKTEVYDEAGKLVATTSAGIKNGLIFTQQTKYVDGSVDTVNFNNGVKSNELIQRADGSRETYTYAIKNQVYVTEHSTFDTKGQLVSFERLHADGSPAYSELRSVGHKIVSWYDAKGLITSQTDMATDGTVTTTQYADGVKSRVFVAHADKTQENTSYGIKGQSYVTEVQKTDAGGKVIDVLRSHADGTLDYHWSLAANGDKVTTSYDAKGRKLSTVTAESDGDRATDLFVAATGALDKQILQRPDGYYSTTVYTNGVKSALYIVNGDGSQDSILYAANGAKTSETLIGVDKSVTTIQYVGGVMSRVFVTHADKTQENTSYGIKGQSYVTEIQKTDAGGKVIDVLRSHADGTTDYHWSLAANGDKVTTTYDAKGHKLNTVTVESDGDRHTELFDAVSGNLTKQIIQDADGDVITKVYTGSVATAIYTVNADGSKETDLYDTSGVLTNVTRQGADGHTETALYTGGVLNRLFVTNVDKTQENTSFNIKGQSYTTEVQKLDASGKVIDVLRSHADGTTDYHWSLAANGDKVTTTYDAKGHKLNTVTVESDGDRHTELFDAVSGNLTKQIIQDADGDVITKVYTGGVATAIYTVNADGSKETDLYDTSGVLTNVTRQGADGHTETALYTGGVLNRLFVTNVDKTQENTSFNIKGQSYTTEVQKLDVSGKVVDVLRSHADGTSDYHWNLATDGVRTTTVYDAAGTRTVETVQQADGSKDVFKFILSGQPGATQHEVYNTSSALLQIDTTNADGTHKIYATAAGVTVQGGDGDDSVNLFGGDTFAFSHGRDQVSNFHADETAANHDVIQVSKSIAANFAALQLTKIGSDTLVAFNEHDTLLLKGIAIGQVNAADFLFV